MQFRVLCFGFLQDGNVGVGVFPQREEILIRGAGFGGVALQHIGAEFDRLVRASEKPVPIAQLRGV